VVVENRVFVLFVPDVCWLHTGLSDEGFVRKAFEFSDSVDTQPWTCTMVDFHFVKYGSDVGSQARTQSTGIETAAFR